MTIKRNNKIAYTKVLLICIILTSFVLIYKTISYISLTLEAQYQKYEIDKKTDEIATSIKDIKEKNMVLKAKNDYIIRNSINLDLTRERLDKLLTQIEENIIVEKTNSRLLDLNIIKLERVKADEIKEYLNYVDVLIEVKNMHKFNTDEHAMLRFKKIIEIPSIKKVLNPIKINGEDFFFKENYLAFRIYKNITN